MNVKLRVLSAGAVFFLGAHSIMAQQVDTLKTQEIAEVVVVAYGTQTKESLTGSVTEVKAKEIKEVTAPNVVQGMTGKVAGVQVSSGNGLPGTAPTVRFRGIGSINGSSDPLYVVDGVPFTGSISAINNQDIESISFLKDAAASSLYGNRAANGVIIITTKKGKRGRTQYSLDSKSGVAMRGIPEYAISNSPSEYYEYYHKILKNDAIREGATPEAAHQIATEGLIGGGQGLGYNVTTVADSQIIGADGRFNPNASILYQEDWKDFLFREGFYTNTHFSAAGATDDTSFYYSLGYENNDTYMVNSNWEKITGRIKADSKLGERIKFGGNVGYSFMKQNAPDGYDGSTAYSNPFQWTRYIAPIYPVHAYTASGQPIYTSTGDKAYDDGTGTIAPFVRRYGALQNPYATAIHDIMVNKINQVFAGGYGTFTILKGLDFTYKLTGEYYNLRGTSMDTPLYGDAVGVGGRLYNWANTVTSLNQQQLLEYNNRFGNLNLNVLAGHETYKRQGDYLETHAVNGFLPDAVYSDMYATLVSIAGNGSPYALESFFGRVNLDWDGKYFLSGSVRRDGSSNFHPDNRWGQFYSIGGSWIVSKEDWFQNNIVNYFKLKGSYGEVGNDNLNRAFPYQDRYSIVQGTTAVPVGVIPYNQVFKGNPDITWEKNKNLNAGLELGFFNNRLTIDAEYFKKRTDDLLFMRPLPLSQGFSSWPENIGDMENRGVEVTVGADLIKTTDFNLHLHGNGTWLTNEILSLPEEEITSGSYILKPGHSMYTWNMREFAGVNADTGAAQWYVLNKETGEKTITETYSSASVIDTGITAVPDVYGGFGADLRYKNVDFGINFAYQFGGTGYDSNWMGLMSGGMGENFHSDFYNAWAYDNTSGTLPVVLPDDPVQNYGTSTLGLISNDYVSLQNVTLGYTFNKDLINFAGINALRMYVLADNVHVWSKRKGYDPRMSYTGVSSSNYSPIRTISFGLNVSF